MGLGPGGIGEGVGSGVFASHSPGVGPRLPRHHRRQEREGREEATGELSLSDENRPLA